MKTLGNIRRTDCVECEIVTACGVYLTFRLGVGKTSLNNLLEVNRKRMGMRPRESILVDAHTLQLARRAAVVSIIAHRAKMHLPAPPIEKRVRRPFQLSFVLK